ncbi:response regulator transcription factor [Floccifex sp.]|uniref:response regulator transcription factor n=1 Tax=Floccifex sp. TaxID=2815810 RepID=UPI003F005C85
MKILVVDDQKEVLDILQILLTAEGYEVILAKNGKEALENLKKMELDLILLDVMMPQINGYQTCLEIRKISNVPILFLSAKSQDSDKTLGYSYGADDYLSKPFSYNELLNRVKALIRRYHVYQGKNKKTSHLKYRNFCFDEQNEIVYKNEERLELTETEYQLFLLFVKHQGQIFSAQHLYQTIWQENYYYGANNTVMVHIRNLRKKIEDDVNHPMIIKTVWGKGYKCDA